MHVNKWGPKPGKPLTAIAIKTLLRMSCRLSYPHEATNNIINVARQIAVGNIAIDDHVKFWLITRLYCKVFNIRFHRADPYQSHHFSGARLSCHKHLFGLVTPDLTLGEKYQINSFWGFVETRRFFIQQPTNCHKPCSHVRNMTSVAVTLPRESDCV